MKQATRKRLLVRKHRDLYRRRRRLDRIGWLPFVKNSYALKSFLAVGVHTVIVAVIPKDVPVTFMRTR